MKRTIKVDWQSIDIIGGAIFTGEFSLHLTGDKTLVFKQIHDAVTEVGGVIRKLSPIGNVKRYPIRVRLSVDVKDLDHLRNIQKKLIQLDNVVSINRTLDDY
jgi:(p)ppGpp synthase/HD superfamily hydrolase